TTSNQFPRYLVGISAPATKESLPILHVARIRKLLPANHCSAASYGDGPKRRFPRIRSFFARFGPVVCRWCAGPYQPVATRERSPHDTPDLLRAAQVSGPGGRATPPGMVSTGPPGSRQSEPPSAQQVCRIGGSRGPVHGRRSPGRGIMFVRVVL